MLFFFVSCKKDAEVVSKQFPVIETLDVSNIDSIGATFNAEFIDLGYSEIIEYGFIFSPYEDRTDISDTLIISADAIQGEFSLPISEKIVENITYYVKAFAKTDSMTVYGNTVEFLSKGSKYNPWSSQFEVNTGGWGTTVGVSNNELGFILYQNEDLYSFNPDVNIAKKEQNIPYDGNSGSFIASFVLEGYIYFMSNDSEKILKYHIESKKWMNSKGRPFEPDGDALFGFAINDTGYFMSEFDFYSFNIDNREWTKKVRLHTKQIYSAEVAGGKAYVMNEHRRIYSYDPKTNSWEAGAKYPGEWNGKIISFSQNGKIYYGGSYGETEIATDFWEYNPESDTWREVGSLPLIHSDYGLFTFSINGSSYLGYYSMGSTVIFKFDAQKIK